MSPKKSKDSGPDPHLEADSRADMLATLIVVLALVAGALVWVAS